MGAFDKLEELNLSNNSLSSTLPQQWGDLSNGAVLGSLQYLDVSMNSLSGSLPPSWGSGFNVSYFCKINILKITPFDFKENCEPMQTLAKPDY